MTLIVETVSHGNVEAGFHSTFTGFSRFGDHAFITRHLCELVQCLAEHPEIKDTQILTYDLERFWERSGEHMEELSQLFGNVMASMLPQVARYEADKGLEKMQGSVSMPDEVNLDGKGEIIPIQVAADEQTASIGEYVMTADHFGKWAMYITRGGLLGWKNQEPDFAQEAFAAIMKSKRELYRRIVESGGRW